jgi:GH24 family phage-related lysozyme (muramidase)
MDRQRLIKRLRDYEGCEYTAYDDSRGYRTVAIGYLLDSSEAREPVEKLGLDFEGVYKGDVALTDEHCSTLLDHKLDVATSDAKRLVSNFGQHPDDVQEVIVDMAYNLGGPRLMKFVKMLAAFEANDYCAAAHEMADSKWAKQVGRRAQDDIAIVQAHCA